MNVIRKKCETLSQCGKIKHFVHVNNLWPFSTNITTICLDLIVFLWASTLHDENVSSDFRVLDELVYVLHL